MKKISFIAPCYNEEAVIEEFYSRISQLAKKHGGYDFEFVIVNDGSEDRSLVILDKLASEDSRLKVIHLAANVGHQTALFAGIEAATGDINVTIDIDLQDPPELLDEFLEKMDEGYDIVHAQRESREKESLFKRATARLFYRFLQMASKVPLIEDCGDFRAFTSQVRETVVRFREKHKYLRGIFVMLGYNQAVVRYRRSGRYAGQTKYTLAKMINLAADAILNFSRLPIRVMFIVSTLMWSLSLIYMVKALISKFVYGTTVAGWTSVIFLQVFFSGILLFFIALIGSYVGRIYEQGQGRPQYWIRYTRNCGEDDESA